MDLYYFNRLTDRGSPNINNDLQENLLTIARTISQFSNNDST